MCTCGESCERDGECALVVKIVREMGVCTCGEDCERDGKCAFVVKIVREMASVHSCMVKSQYTKFIETVEQHTHIM